jgi:hypothetical protein
MMEKAGQCTLFSFEGLNEVEVNVSIPNRREVKIWLKVYPIARPRVPVPIKINMTARAIFATEEPIIIGGSIFVFNEEMNTE